MVLEGARSATGLGISRPFSRAQRGHRGAAKVIRRRGWQLRSYGLAIALRAMRERRAAPARAVFAAQPHRTAAQPRPEARRHGRTELAPPARDAATPRGLRACRSACAPSTPSAAARAAAGAQRRRDGGARCAKWQRLDCKREFAT